MAQQRRLRDEKNPEKTFSRQARQARQAARGVAMTSLRPPRSWRETIFILGEIEGFLHVAAKQIEERHGGVPAPSGQKRAAPNGRGYNRHSDF